MQGVGYGMGMDLHKSQFLDGCPDGSGTKTKSYEPCLKAYGCVSILLVLNVHNPTYLGSRGKPFFLNEFFCLPIVDNNVWIHLYIWPQLTIPKLRELCSWLLPMQLTPFLIYPTLILSHSSLGELWDRIKNEDNCMGRSQERSSLN